MSVRPALVDCVVLSLQDACVFYPCCKGCFSRIQVDQRDPTRCRCSRCGYICLRDSVDHRYRLSLRVTRDECIFGVTVFGSCLNPFFGIHATGLQRLVENPDGPGEETTRSTLLMKAVRDCFIGRHVIFGIKVTETEPKPWLQRPPDSCSRHTKDTVQFITSQMIIPKALSPGSCTVLSYYQVLLQKNAGCVLGAADQSKSFRRQEAPLMLLLHHSTTSSIGCASPCTSSLLNHSLQRSQHQDCTLTPTPPWQQSLGLVTSSAEQEEGCSTQESNEDDARKRNRHRKLTHTYRDNSGYHSVVEERRLFSNSSADKAPGNSPIVVTQLCPSSPDHNSSKTRCLSTSHLANTYLSDSLAWEDLPFSESLTEFLGEENKDVIVGNKSEPNVKVLNQKETITNDLEIRSQSKDSFVELCAGQKYTEKKDNHSIISVGVNNTVESTRAVRHDISEQVCEKPVGCVHNSQAETLVFQENKKTNFVAFEDDEEQLKGNTFNCSADLFSSSPEISVNTSATSMHTDNVVASTEVSTLLSLPKKYSTSGGNLNISHLTPHKHKLRSNKCIIGDYSILPGTQDIDFIPPSQSTPIVRVAAGVGLVSKRTVVLDKSQPHSPDSCSFYKSLPKLNFKETPKICPSFKSKDVSANQLPRSGEATKENLWITSSSRRKVRSKKRFWKHKRHLLAQKSPRAQKETPDSGSPRRLDYTCDSSYDGTLCNNLDKDSLLVPPTPAAKPTQSARLRTQTQTGCCIGKMVHTEEQQDDGASVTSLRREVQTRNFDTETNEKDMFDRSSYYLQDGENEACDWSRDLFSDSV